MKKQAMIKMIDTYIRQLNEIKSDINNMITEDTSDLTTCSNEGAAKYIVAMLKDRDTKDIKDILKEVDLRLNMLNIRDIFPEQLVRKTMNSKDVEELLAKSNIGFISRRDKGDGSKWIILVDQYDQEVLGFNFSETDLLLMIKAGRSLNLKYTNN